MATSEPLIELNSVGLALDGRAILKNVSLQVFPGEVLALVGPNGAGKSSLLSVMSGDVQATTGRALLQGRDVSKYRVDEAARQRSVLMQSNEVSFPFTVAEIVEMGRAPWARTTSLADDNKAIAEALEKADVEHLVERRFNQLSGGERARVSLARVLAQRTPVVLLDEPTAALDLKHQESVMKTVRRIAGEGRAGGRGGHDLSVACRLCRPGSDDGGGQNCLLWGVRTMWLYGRAGYRTVYGVAVDIELVGSPARPVIIPRR
jgi:iron complex transport system ATP-binding protein